MNAMTSLITDASIACSAVCSGADEKTKTLKLRVTAPCEGNSTMTGEFPALRASNVEKVSI